MNTKQVIISQTTTLFSLGGIDGMSMRELAYAAGVSPSVLYYYYKDKNALLKDMFDTINTKLGKERSKLPPVYSASEMLFQRISFQFDHAKEVVAVLKYYLLYRKEFKKKAHGFIPEKAYLHIDEVIDFGIKTGEFTILDKEVAKIITHTINGFILEYYPKTPTGKEREKLITTIQTFLYTGIKHYEKK
jgi:AcrR family transcriptional regulator